MKEQEVVVRERNGNLPGNETVPRNNKGQVVTTFRSEEMRQQRIVR